MTATPPPRAPLPDWSDGLREGTESLTVRPDRVVGQPLAIGTNEGDEPTRDELQPLDLGQAEQAEQAEQSDRTKVDVRLPKFRPAKTHAKPDDEGERLVGTTLGSYHLLSRIGKGGMGHVFLAEHVRLGRQVALKLLRQEHAKRKDAVARFFQEARTVNRVRHRNIVDVTDFVELDDGRTFIIMELLTGQSLGVWARGGIEVPRALAVLAQICEGLGAAHSVDVIHRDLKPDNVIITATPEGQDLIKLLDFGVAKLINQRDDDFGVETAAGSVVGTPAYMSPEQAGGLPIDGRSDIYSLGAIMYELFCGQTMFRGRSFGEFVRKHLTEQPLQPRATPHGAGLDPRIETIILRAIEKEPARRYQTVLELREALLQLIGAPAPAAVAATRRVPTLPGEATSRPSSSPPSETTAGSGFHQHSGISDLDRSGAYLDRFASTYHPPSTHMVRSTPWYVWFVGGALAVGLGAGGAAWYVSSTEPPAMVLAQPIAAAAAAASLTELRVTSTPSGSALYKRGGSAELCRTPCALKVDLAEFGDLTVRPFVLRHPGFQDTPLLVDLKATQRQFQVPLTPLVEEPPIALAADEDLQLEPDEPAAAPAAAEPRRRGKAARKPAPKSKPSTKSSTKSSAADVKLPAARSKPVIAEPARPILKPPPEKAGKIDRSETIDPFRTP